MAGDFQIEGKVKLGLDTSEFKAGLNSLTSEAKSAMSAVASETGRAASGQAVPKTPGLEAVKSEMTKYIEGFQKEVAKATATNRAGEPKYSERQQAAALQVASVKLTSGRQKVEQNIAAQLESGEITKTQAATLRGAITRMFKQLDDEFSNVTKETIAKANQVRGKPFAGLLGSSGAGAPPPPRPVKHGSGGDGEDEDPKEAAAAQRQRAQKAQALTGDKEYLEATAELNQARRLLSTAILKEEAATVKSIEAMEVLEVSRQQLNAILHQELSTNKDYLKARGSLAVSETVAKAGISEEKVADPRFAASELQLAQAQTAEARQRAEARAGNGKLQEETIALGTATAAETAELKRRKIQDADAVKAAADLLNATRDETRAVKQKAIEDRATAAAAQGITPSRYQQAKAAVKGFGGEPVDPLDQATFGQDLKSRFLMAGQYAIAGLSIRQTLQTVTSMVTEAENLEKVFNAIDLQLKAIGLDDSFGQVRSSVLSMSKDLGIAADQLAQIEARAIGVYQNIQQATEATKAVGELQVVSGLPGEEIFKNLEPAALAFDTTIGAIGDKVVGLSQRMGVSMKETIAFFGRASEVAATTGITLDQLGAIAGTLQQRISIGGTAAADLFDRVATAAGQNVDKILQLASRVPALSSQMGELTKDFAIGDTGPGLILLARSWNQIGESAQSALLKLIANRREMATFKVLLDNLGPSLDTEGAHIDDNGKLVAANAAQQATLAQHIARLKEGLRQLGDTLARAGIGDLLKDAATVAETLGGTLGIVLKIFVAFNDATGHMVGRLIALALAIKAVQAALRFGGTLRAGPLGTGLLGPVEEEAAADTAIVAASRAQLAGRAVAGARTAAFAGGRFIPSFFGRPAPVAGPPLPVEVAGPPEPVPAYGPPEPIVGAPPPAAAPILIPGAGRALAPGAEAVAGEEAAGLSLGAFATSLPGLIAIGATIIAINKAYQGTKQQLAEQGKKTFDQMKKVLDAGDEARTKVIEDIVSQNQGLGSSLAQAIGLDTPQQEAKKALVASKQASSLAALSSLQRSNIPNLKGTVGVETKTYLGLFSKSRQVSLQDLIDRIGKGDAQAIVEADKLLGDLKQDPAVKKQIEDAIALGKSTSDQAAGLILETADSVVKGFKAGRKSTGETFAAINDALTRDETILADQKEQGADTSKIQEEIDSLYSLAQDALNTVVSRGDQMVQLVTAAGGSWRDVIAGTDREVKSIEDALAQARVGSDAAQALLVKILQLKQESLKQLAEHQSNATLGLKVLNQGITVTSDDLKKAGYTLPGPLPPEPASTGGATGTPGLRTYGAPSTPSQPTGPFVGSVPNDAWGGGGGAGGSVPPAPTADDLRPDGTVFTAPDGTKYTWNKAKNAWDVAPSASEKAILERQAITEGQAKFTLEKSKTRDPVQQAQIALDAAKAQLAALKKLPDVKDSEIQAAEAAVNDAQNGLDDANAAANDAKLRLSRAQIGTLPNAVADAKLAKDLAHAAYDRAHGDAAKADALAAEIKADQGYKDALQSVADSRTNLLITMASSVGDDVKATQLRLASDKAALDRAIAQGGAGDEFLNQLRGTVAQDTAAALQAQLSNTEDIIDFQLQMGQITKGQAVAQLQAELPLVAGNQKATRDLLLKIHGLMTDQSSQLQFNIGDLKLPTLYEVNRLAHTSAAGTGYNDNRQITVTMHNYNSTDYQGSIDQFVDLANQPSRYGTYASIYPNKN